MPPTTHPTLLVYKNTLSEEFPLIICIGREPGITSSVVNTIGYYDFDAVPTCGFWNTSYSVFSQINNTEIRPLKNTTRLKESSPIVYADASLTGIPFGASDVNSLRDKNSRLEKSDPASNIFSHNKVIKRTKLILLSGLDHKRYNKFNTSISAKAAKHGILIFKIPFFFGTNTQKILSKIKSDKPVEHMLKHIYSIWK